MLSSCNFTEEDLPSWVIHAPADRAYTKIDKEGRTVIPNGRFVQPYGKTISVAPHPYGLCLSPDGNIAVTANSGVSPFSISILEGIFSDSTNVTQIPEGPYTKEDVFPSIFMGLAISPNHELLYVSGGQTNQIYKVDLASKQIIGTISCNQRASENDLRDYSHGFIGDLLMSTDGKTLYGVDHRNFRLFIMDLETERITHNIEVGRYPFALALSPNEDQLYVANVGAFEYKKITSIDDENLWETALDFPAYAYLSKEMIEGIDTDTLKIPPLGDPNAPESFSVWKIDLKASTPQVTAKIKTGMLVGDLVEGIPAFGGSSPNSIAVTNEYVFVSNGHNDCISVIDIQTDTIVQNIYLQPDSRLGHLRGIIPFGLTVSKDFKRLYVAESGINAVAVIDIPTLQVVGHIPTGWFPAKVELSNDDQKLIVTNAKGFGSGPNGGKEVDLKGRLSYIGFLMKGSVTVMDIPTDEELKGLTDQVVANNFRIEEVTSPNG